jgi:hypothetical protein
MPGSLGSLSCARETDKAIKRTIAIADTLFFMAEEYHRS